MLKVFTVVLRASLESKSNCRAGIAKLRGQSQRAADLVLPAEVMASLRWHGAHVLDTSFVFSPLANTGQHTGFEDLPWAPIDAKHLESKEELSRPGLVQQTRDIVTCTPCTQDCRGTAWPGLGDKGACSGEKGRGGREERLLFD